MISIFDIYKIGVGPSSSHTVGPMKAGKIFVDELKQKQFLQETDKLTVDVYGSLSLTGIGHRTDVAIIAGLAGNLPETVDIDAIDPLIAEVEKLKC
ncbi:L-serine dehydratase [Vibrio sp. JCM 19236]|nr:L-serine dehydratase [Vibrio sp. JCM 19236]